MDSSCDNMDTNLWGGTMKPLIKQANGLYASTVTDADGEESPVQFTPFEAEMIRLLRKIAED